MPKLKGFDFLRTLQNGPQIIVTTAHKEHALTGYELAVVDYLLKPFSFERFLKAVHKVNQGKSTIQPGISTNSEENQVFLYSDKKYTQVNLKDILFVEAAGNYCKLVLTEDQLLIREKNIGCFRFARR